MLSLYGSFKVPGVDRVTIFRDDETPHKFYMITDKPSILTEADGTPMLDFISYARNPAVVLANLKDGAPPTDLERGHMQLTVGLQISKADEAKILAFLGAQLTDEKAMGFRYLNIPVTITEPELGYPPFFVDGTASVNAFNDELQRAAVSSVEPAKSGVCPASFSYDLTQEGAALMLQSLRSDSLPVMARYEGMKFAARIPSLKITIAGDRSEIFKELHQRLVAAPFVIGGIHIMRKSYWNPPTLGDFRSTCHSLTVTIDDSDFRSDAAANDDTAKALEDMALGILEKTIIPSFFEPMIEIDAKTEDDKKQSSWWLRDEQTSFSGTINMTFSKRDVLLIEHNANGQIGGNLSAAQKDKAVRVLDLSHTEFDFMNMVVYPNINFETDPVFALQVFITYDQMDDKQNVRVKHQEEAVFQKGWPPVRKVFKLARAADGTPKRGYKYFSSLTYISSTTTPVVTFPPQGGAIDADDSNLIITYPNLGHVKSMITLGAVPEIVSSVRATVAYADTSIAGSTQIFELSRDHASAVYLLNTNKLDAEKKYSVSCLYRLTDGSEIAKAAQDFTGESVVVSSPFEDRQETAFAATGNFTPIGSLALTAHYEDKTNGYKQSFSYNFTKIGEAAKWSVPLVDKTATDFIYDVITLNKDGSKNENKGQKGKLGGLITVGGGGLAALSVIVDGGSVDWNRFSLVFVQLEYGPPGGDVTRHTIRMAPGFGFEEWKVLIDDPRARTYRRKATFIGKNANDKVDTSFEDSSEPFYMPTVTP
jgi:hypothetical protein